MLPDPHASGTATVSPEPDGAPRLPVLDVLRGIAILGILFMNVNDMGASMTASFGDARHLGWTRADQVAWWCREVLANGTARCLLEMLFGAGMLMLTTRAARVGDDLAVARGYLRRNLVLFAFGLAHILVLLWPGDILHTYAIAATVAFPFRRLRPRLLIAIGLSYAGVQLLGGGLGYLALTQQQAAVARIESRAAGTPLTPGDRAVLADAARDATARQRARAKEAADVVREDHARTAGPAEWAHEQWWQIAEAENDGAEIGWVWEAAATMLIGAALFRLDVLAGGRSPRFYTALAATGYVVGLAIRVPGAAEAMRFDRAPHVIWATGEVGRLAMTLGHLGLVNRLMASAAGARALAPFRAAGRAALSIYIAQSLLCLWLLFPPFALALYGRLGWAALMGVALAVDAGLLLVAVWWMRRFAIAPVEWAWRSIVDRRALPWRAPVFAGRKRV